MKYCKSCNEQVTTRIKFDRNGIMYLVCNECDKDMSERTDSDDDIDYYVGGFMNDFGDSN